MQMLQSQKLAQRPNGSAISQPLQYGEALADALLCYARNNERFAHTLLKLLKRLPSSNQAYPPLAAREGIQILIPSEAHAATRRAEWLISRIVENSIPGAQKALAMLTAYAAEKPAEDSKQLIIGIVGFAIPGITLGYWDKKERMLIIVRRDLADNATFDVSRSVTQASIGVLQRAFEMAGGDARKLEPEIADWFFGERGITFCAADPAELSHIVYEVQSLDIIHSVMEKEAKPAVVAISPVINRSCERMRWKVKQLTS